VCLLYSECTRGGFCNFMHLKPISRELRRRLYGRSKKRSVSPVICTQYQYLMYGTLFVVTGANGKHDTESGQLWRNYIPVESDDIKHWRTTHGVK